MASRIVIEGNAFYEIDEECMLRRKEQQRRGRRECETQECCGRKIRRGQKKG